MILEKHVYSLDNVRRGSYYMCAALNPAMQSPTTLSAQNDGVRTMKEWRKQTDFQLTDLLLCKQSPTHRTVLGE